VAVVSEERTQLMIPLPAWDFRPEQPARVAENYLVSPVQQDRPVSPLLEVVAEPQVVEVQVVEPQLHFRHDAGLRPARRRYHTGI
jgi:hypothetical protein